MINLECLLIEFESFVERFCYEVKKKELTETNMLRIIARNVSVNRIERE